MKKQLLLLFVALLITVWAKAQILTADPNEINSLNTVFGQGPSIAQTYNLAGQNLEGEQVTVNASNNFEISVDGNDYFQTIVIPVAEDSTLVNQPVTLYVRLMAELLVDDYQGVIHHEGGGAILDVQVSGAVEATIPTVTLNNIFNIEETSAVANATVTDDGGATISKKGVCWNTTGNPTNGDTHVSIYSGEIGDFDVNITNLNSNTTYFVKAYAINSKGTAYSDQLEFTTTQEQTVPTVITAEVTNIGQTTASGGGNVTHDGNVDVTARGICWGISHDPTINDAFSNDGPGTGSYTVDMTNLQPGTTYYVRAYAINGIGIAYGEEKSFTTYPITYNIEVDYNEEGGSVSVEPSIAQEHTTINIIININEDYELQSLSAFNTNDITQAVTIAENNTFEMPAYDVMVKAIFAHKQGAVGDIEAPNPICAGDVLDLTEPDYEYHLLALHKGWQLSSQPDFEEFIEFENQPLDASYNGWWLRFVVSYIWGNSFSNSVQIIVNNMDGFALIGDNDICTNQESEYFISGIENDSIVWQVSDSTAIVTIEDDHIKVLWATAGQHQIYASVTDFLTGCFTQLEMDVTVNAFIDASTLNEIVKKDNYILIYPNPVESYKYQWYKDGDRIEGANYQYYYQAGGLDNGNYKVYVSFNEDTESNLICGAFSKEIVINGQSAASLSVYPNPSHIGETISVVNNDNEKAMLTIYALDGRLLHSQTIVGNHASLSLSLSKGIYVIRLTNSRGSKIEKIVIQ
jgi:hypothetical protein